MMENLFTYIGSPEARYLWGFIIGEFFRMYTFKGLGINKRLKGDKKKSEWLSETAGYLANFIAIILMYLFLDKNIELLFTNLVFSMSLHMLSVRGLWKLIDFLVELKDKNSGKG